MLFLPGLGDELRWGTMWALSGGPILTRQHTAEIRGKIRKIQRKKNSNQKGMRVESANLFQNFPPRQF